MSFREYQNRKKAKPTSVVHNSTTNSSETISSKNLNNHKSELLTDTDSLLTPRTLSLSNSFVPLPERDSTLLTTSVGLVPPSVTIQEISLPQQQTVEVSSNGPVFEPVSPSEEYPSLASSKERGILTIYFCIFCTIVDKTLCKFVNLVTVSSIFGDF